MTAELRLTITAAVATALAAAGLAPAYRTAAWVPPALVAIAAVAAGAHGGRRLAVPRSVVPILGLAALVVSLTYLFARDHAWLWLVPNVDVVAAMADLTVAGLDTIETSVAPVELEAGLSFVTAAGLGLAALVVDTIAVTLRRPAASGLGLLGIYGVPASVLAGGVGWGAFALGAAGFLALLLTDARDKVGRWGRAIDRDGAVTRDATTPLAAVGRRVGVAAVGLAVLVPVVVPGLDRPLLGGGSGLGTGRGTNTVAVVNPILDLGQDLTREDDREVLRYQTRDETPSYVRLVVLDNFTGDVWEPTRLRVPASQTVDRGLVAPVGLASSTARDQVRTDVEIQQFETRWLPLPFPAQLVEDIAGDWLWDEATFNVFSVESSTRGLRYTVTSLDVQPSRSELAAAGTPRENVERFLALPEDAPPDIAATAAELTADLESPYERAVALQEWLRDPSIWTYDEQAPEGTGFDAIGNFLRERRGFCIHFASTMAVMARALDIPARVAVGFIPGEQVEPGTWSVTTHDAHAWPELYFEGAGWLPFEPTPAQRTGAPPPYAQPLDDAEEGDPAADAASTAAPSAGPSAGVPGADGGLSAEDRIGLGEDLGLATQEEAPWVAMVVGVAAALTALAPATARVLLRRRRWRRATDPRRRARAAWDETRDLTVDYGVEIPDLATPRQFVELVAGEAALGIPARQALQRIAQAAEREQYAREVGEVGNLRGAVSTFRSGLVRHASRRRRLGAVLLPASTAQLLQAAGERVADGLDALDRAVASVRERVPPTRRRPAP